MRDKLIKKIDLYSSLLLDILAFVNIKYSQFSKDFFNELIQVFIKRVENSDLEDQEKNELVNKILDLKEEFEKNKNFKKSSFLKEFIKFLKKRVKSNLEITRILNNIRFKYIVFNKKALHKLKEKKYEDAIFLIKNLLYSDLSKTTKQLNDILLEARDKNLVLIVRKDSLFIDYLIIEDMLNLELINDFRIYEFYKKGLLKPKEEENKELEELVIDGKKRLINYFIEDSVDFLLKNYF